MSQATDWVALVASRDVADAEVEAQRPQPIVVGPFTFSVNDQGGMHVHGGQGNNDLTIEEVGNLYYWMFLIYS